MKNNKGFSLIEITTVIIIIGILISIAVFSVNQYIVSSKKDAYVITANIYIQAAREQYAKEQFAQEAKEGEALVIPISKLDVDKNKGYKSPYGQLDLTRSYVIIVRENNKNIFYVALIDAKQYGIDVVKEDDLEAKHVLKGANKLENIKTFEALKGNNTQILISGKNYSISSRNYENTSTILLNSNTSSETIIPGPGEIVACKISVTGTSPLNNGWYSSNVKLVLNMSSNVKYFDLTRSSVPTYYNNTSGTQFDDTNSTTWYGYVKDSDGNTNTCSFVVHKDTLVPTIHYSLSGGQFYSAQTVTVATLDDNFNYMDVNVYKNGVLDATKSVTNRVINTFSVELNSEATWVIYTSGYDKSGNKHNQPPDNGSGWYFEQYKITLQMEIPTCSITLNGNSPLGNQWYNSNVQLSLSKSSTASSFGLSTSPIANYDGLTEANQTADTTGTRWYGYVKNLVGNTNTCSIVVYKDTKKPTTPVITNPTNGNWTNQNIVLTVESSDENGIAYWQYSYDNINWTTYSGSNVGRFDTTPFSAERNQLAYIRVVDNAGNVSDSSSTYIRIDKTTPECSISASGTLSSNGWYKSNVTLTLNRSDVASSIGAFGIQTSSSVSYNGSASATQTADTSGITWHGFVKDNAGNTGTCSLVVKKGKELSSIAIVTNNVINYSLQLKTATLTPPQLVRLTFSDGTTSDVSSGYTTTGYAPSMYGNQTITVSYQYNSVSGVSTTETATYGIRVEYYTSKKVWIAGLYYACLGRTYDDSGLAGHFSTISTLTPSQTVMNFVNSTEFINRNLNATDFVKAMYWAILGREATQSDWNFWVPEYNSKGKKAVVDGILASNEFNNRWATLPLQ